MAALSVSASAGADGPVVVLSGEADPTTAAVLREMLAAHRTPVSGRGRGPRLLRVLLRSPLPVFRAVCGTEWFAEPGGRTGELVARDQAARPGPTELVRDFGPGP